MPAQVALSDRVAWHTVLFAPRLGVAAIPAQASLSCRALRHTVWFPSRLEVAAMLGQLPSLPVQEPWAVKCPAPQSLNPNRERSRSSRRPSPGAALRGPVDHWPCVDAANARRNTSGRTLRAARGESRSRAKVDQRWPRPARLQRRVKIAPSRAVAAPQQGWSVAPTQGRSGSPIAKPQRAPVAAQARTLAAHPAIWPPRPVREPPVREHLPAPRSQHAWSLLHLHAWSLVQLP